jgi:hypothetical protein
MSAANKKARICGLFYLFFISSHSGRRVAHHQFGSWQSHLDRSWK